MYISRFSDKVLSFFRLTQASTNCSLQRTNGNSCMIVPWPLKSLLLNQAPPNQGWPFFPRQWCQWQTHTWRRKKKRIRNGTNRHMVIKQWRWDNEIFHSGHLQIEMNSWLSWWNGEWGGRRHLYDQIIEDKYFFALGVTAGAWIIWGWPFSIKKKKRAIEDNETEQLNTTSKQRLKLKKSCKTSSNERAGQEILLLIDA